MVRMKFPFRWRRGVVAGVRSYMVGLALITTLPLAIFAVLIVGELRSSEFESLRQRTDGEAEGIARLVDRQIHDMITTLLVLETSPELRGRDFGRFHSRAKAALSRGGWYMLVVDEDGTQLLNTRVDYGAPLGQTGNMEAHREVLTNGGVPLVSDVFVGRTSNRFVYNVMKAIDVPGSSPERLVLILTQDAEDLNTLIGRRELPPQWAYALVDGEGKVVAASDKPSGEAFPEEVLSRARFGALQGADATPNEMMGYAAVGLTNWRVVVWGPSGTAVATIASTWYKLIGAGIAFFLLSLFSAMVFGRKLQSAIKAVSQRAEGVGRGEIVSPLATGIREIDQVSEALSEASFDRSQAEERLEVVLREMAHRTKNVILVAQALVRQTARHSADKDAFVSAITGRMGAFALSLDLLTSTGTSSPTFRTLADAQLQSFLEPGTRFTAEGEDFGVLPQAVKEIGMLLHEFATNAMKYGAFSVEEGQVDLTWEETEVDGRPALRFVWRESGGPSPQEPPQKGFGSVLVQSTVQSLQGTAVCDYLPEGVRWTVEIPTAMIRAKG